MKNALYVFFRTVEFSKTSEIEERVIADFDHNGHITEIEILDSGKRLTASDIVKVSIENLTVWNTHVASIRLNSTHGSRILCRL